MMDKDGKFLRYSGRQRLYETKRLKYQRLISNLREKLGILEIEKQLNGYSSKTCDFEKFQEYIKIKNKVNNELFDLYRDDRFRKYRWYGFIMRQRSFDNMLNRIENTYGKDIIIIHGDWSQGKQMRSFMSTPNIGLKRKLAERFKVYNIDEFRTSKLHHKTEEECSNLKLKDKTGKYRELHAVLTSKMENGRLGCINRDRNACYNMKKIFEYFLENDKARPEKYCRSRKGQEEKEDYNDKESKKNENLQETFC
jgi:hypothetical protein